MRRCLAGFAFLALAGCAASQCDPNQADFFTGIGCVAGGGYQQRTAAAEAQLAQSQQQLAAAEGSAEVAQANDAAEQSKVAALQEGLAEENAELGILQARLDSERAQHADRAAQLEAMQQRIAALRAVIGSALGDPNLTAAKAERLQAEKDQLLALAAHM